ncbi:hypothetical protein EDEG_03361 [Edhazardia aedis USNM 41457]|uniref:Uncharacterized protein n=1 Tax=Edhazardia aedis (strain USNM 41457) TaxID=1003232 RepID=J9DLH1_EDHAE|nr:hypothetical protein EDEG_03361 [Edhazardia aedis USNM 41457]|eukprot:EJW02207.1 hypothetical protein EDEG_03361 [Edhazardia aedis USNM 41457]
MKQTHAIIHLDYIYSAAILTKDKVIRRSLIKKFVSIANRFQVKLDKSVKRTICKKCLDIFLINENCEVSLIKMPEGLVYKIFCKCGNVIKYVIRGSGKSKINKKIRNLCVKTKK